MTDHEKQTIEYILSMEWDELDVWLDQRTDEEVHRILLILKTGLAELIVRGMEDEEENEYLECDTAQALLQRFMRHGTSKKT